MPLIKFIEADGAEHDALVDTGVSAMRAAVENNVPGIDGDCGGVMACATCHVFVDAAWIIKTGRASEGTERQMLEFTDCATENSRLACQITMTDTLDGLVLRLPDKQF